MDVIDCDGPITVDHSDWNVCGAVSSTTGVSNYVCGGFSSDCLVAIQAIKATSPDCLHLVFSLMIFVLL